MAKRTSKTNAGKGTFALVMGGGAILKKGSAKGRRAAKTHVVTFGSAVARSSTTGRFSEVHIKAGQDALKRAETKLVRPGVNLKARKGAALYRADPDNPGGLIREIDGRVERVIFEGDDFKVRQ
jgi:hypothetical protein